MHYYYIHRASRFSLLIKHRHDNNCSTRAVLAPTSYTYNCVKPHPGSFFFLFFFFKKKNKRSKLVNTCFYHTYNSVKLSQPMSNTSTPWVMLSMETVALFKSSNKHHVNVLRNQTYCPSELLTKAVLESIQQAAPSKTALQTVWGLGYSAEYRQVGCHQDFCTRSQNKTKNIY